MGKKALIGGGIGLLVVVAVVVILLIRTCGTQQGTETTEEKKTSQEETSQPSVQEETPVTEVSSASGSEEAEEEANKPPEGEKEEVEKKEETVAEKKEEEEKEEEKKKLPPPPAPSDMVHIPEGTFLMGSIDGDQDEQPVNNVWLDHYYIDRHEVTVKQFQKFSNETGYPMPKQPEWSGEDYPVVNVTWEDAAAYARWIGKRLPTEAEWEKAARGGLINKIFPWGNRSAGARDANFADKRTELSWKEQDVDDGYRYAAPVRQYSPNGYGLYDMAGNIWEWCADWYDPHYYKRSSKKNPKGPKSGYRKVVRGGSWLYASYNMRCSSRNGLEPYYRAESGGFRCALSVKIP
jgi:formylglycine-generating enzyme required for sulfatase activity